MSDRLPIRALRAMACAAVWGAFSAASVRADVSSATALGLDFTAGLNYETADVVPKVRDAPAGATLTLVANDAKKGVLSQAGLSTNAVTRSFAGRTAGRSLALDGYVIASDGVTTNAVTHDLRVMGNVHTNDGWLCETAATYAGGTGSGTWTGREYASVSGDRIVVNTTKGGLSTSALTCTVGAVPAPCRGFTISASGVFPMVYYALPDLGGQRFGLTIAAIDDDNPNDTFFYYVETNGWTRVPVAVCDPLASTNWQVHISVDCDAGEATYYVRPSDDRPWTILGTAKDVGGDTSTEVSFRGEGALLGVKGNGFDTQLLQVGVTFDAGTLYPGLNMEETVVTGRVSSTVVHSTDRLGGTYAVRLTDLRGNEILTRDFSFTAEGEMEFYVRASDLVAGTAYRAEIVLGSAVAEAAVSNAVQVGVMGRAVEDEDGSWGGDGRWVYENARTFDGLDEGTGDWSGRASASTSEKPGWIHVATPAGGAVAFTATNAIGEVTSGYVAGIRALFTNEDMKVTFRNGAGAIFGFTVATTDSGYRFQCLSNGVWTTVSSAIAVPTLGTDYAFTAYVRPDLGTLDCLVSDAVSGMQVQLMSVDLDAELRTTLFQTVEITGEGYVTDLTGTAHSTVLVRMSTSFDKDRCTLWPSTNFTATAANGIVRFQTMWETDHTNGQILVVVRDKTGRSVGQRRISFHDLSGEDFDYFVTGLVPGEVYSVTVTTEIKGIEEVTGDAATGSMARIVTNDLWTTEGWIREDADTFDGSRTPGSGIWTRGGSLAIREGDYIRIQTGSSGGLTVVIGDGTEGSGDAHASFQTTNDLPKKTGYEYRVRLVFSDALTALPSAGGIFGIAVVGDAFAVLTNGVWTAVDAEIFQPDLTAEYELTIRVDLERMEASYLIRSVDETVPTLLASYGLPEKFSSAAPDVTDFYGNGLVRSLEGDGFDVTVVEMWAEVDASLLTPGTNFASTVAKGVLHINPLWLTDGTSGSYTITVRDAHGKAVASQSLTYPQLEDQEFDFLAEGLAAGETYDVEIVADRGGEPASSNRFTAVMARTLGGWIRETPQTFLGGEKGTGLWLETNGTASVVGNAILIDASRDGCRVGYLPTNESASVRCSTVREIRANLDFGDIGWAASESAPEPPANTLAAVTVWGDDTDGEVTDRETALAVISTNGQWLVLDGTRRRGLLENGSCTVVMLIDLASGFVRYELIAGGTTNRVHQYDFEASGPEALKVSFSGSGSVNALDGDAWDPNLIAAGTNEYAGLDAAIRATEGDGETLTALWDADQLVTVGKGAFRIDDSTGYALNVRFPDWYYFEVSTNGSVRVFRFNQSNNWIDYAERGDGHIDLSVPGVYLVKTPEGLSWIAAQATNAWIGGRIELAGDIDLSKHNWTPIAGFTGTFDGRGRTVKGLNNAFHNGRPGGEYVSGPTNAWGRSAYGLFGTATNATLTGVTFTDVAVSNIADSVAALAGALAGDCAVSNVTVESGSVLGLGGTVAGLVGLADFGKSLTFVGNTNRANVAARNALYGEGRWAAGLLCVGAPAAPDDPGSVVVTGNANFGVVSNSIYDADLSGGNVAQILAGTTRGARFGTKTRLTGNAAAGSVGANLVRSPDNSLVQTNFPAVNLASAFWGYDEFGTFYRFLEANADGAVAVDPVRRTARMLSGMYAHGAENPVGAINDRISASESGATVTLADGLDSWEPIILDRDLTFDLGGHSIYTIYVDNTFVVSNGVAATVRNGTIAIGPESKAFVGDTDHLNTNDNLTVEHVPYEFYERTTVSVNGEPISTLYSSVLMSAMNASGSVIDLSGTDVEIDVDAGVLRVGGRVVAELTDCYGFKVTEGADGQVCFEVKIADSAAPTAEFTMTGGEQGTVGVTVGNAREGFWYALQYKNSLAEEWVTPPAEEWVRATADGAVLTAPTDGNQGFYRVLMSDVRGGSSDE